ncbi:MAG TPA: diacylglycerol kinase family protein [Vicinamibacterales bacterium]|jgi:YegS/Rv2252/BmrU family lipid kinase
MSTLVIVNPVSGGRRRGLTWEQRLRIARAALDRHGDGGRVVMTEHAGHAHELARCGVAEGRRAVVAWGGDGTINEVASAVADTDVALGVVPAGSGNGLARELRLPRSPVEALDIAFAGSERLIDAGRVNGHWFVNIAGVGFDAAMAEAFNALGQQIRGPVRYVLSVARAGFTYQPVEYHIDVDGRHIRVHALLVALANLRQYGINAVIAPAARPDDGAMDLVIVESRGILGRLALVPRLFNRTIHRAPRVTILPARRVTIRAAQPMVFHCDGETWTAPDRVEAVTHPGALRIRVAAGAETSVNHA